jgi:sulfur carrier protein ThiS
MEIKVILFTILKKYGKGKLGKDNSVTVPEHMNLDGLLSHLDIPDKKGKILLVNGSPQDMEYRLNEGDEVKILSFIGGG